MRDLTEKALEICSKEDATYADIRIVTIKDEDISIKKGNIQTLNIRTTTGFGIRTIANGGLGFAGSYDVSGKEIERVAKLAVRIAKASGATRKKPIVFVDEKPVEDNYQTPIKKDPFSIPSEEKINLLMEADKRMRDYNPEVIKMSRADYRGHKEDQIFASLEGAYITQQITFCGGGISCTAITQGEPPQTRSFPGSFRGNFSTKGYEYFESLKLLENTDKTAKEAITLTTAKHCPTDRTTLLLDGHQLMLQIHESCGHPTELDRVLGTEAAYAGTSFMTPDLLGKLKYGSEFVNMTSDCTIPGGLGTYGYDHEGVKAKRVDLVKEGLFVGYQSSRETAAILGLKESSAGMRADSPQKLPLVRMTNISLEPGNWKREELIADTKKGILMSTNKSWSIDDKRLNFQFGTEIAWEIIDGEIGQILKNPTYTGITPEFWGSMNAHSKDDWKVLGTPNCGKGQPGQVMYVGHGCGTARFNNVRVGVMQEATSTSGIQ
ncbi:MAG TPA: TldD/PmbA family protein [candidate division Zixibacteria bacterium]|nr:TldD/PmbA family protein [candidate division Zixibacteria bacterium]